MPYFYDKYNILTNKLRLGEIVQPKILSKISNDKAIVNINGYKTILQSSSLNEIDDNTKFLVTNFNSKEKTIILKMLKIPDEDLKLKEYIYTKLLKFKLPVNNFTFKLAEILYENYGEISYNIISNSLRYLKYSNDPDLIFALLKLNLNEDLLIKILKIFQNSDKLFLNLKNIIKTDNNIKKLNKNLKALLQSDDKEIKTIGLKLRLYNILNYTNDAEFIFLFPFLWEREIYLIKIKYKEKSIDKKIIFLNIEVPVSNSFVIFRLKYIENEKLEIRIESEDKEIMSLIKENIKELLEKIKKVMRIEIEIIWGEKKDLDIYI